MFIDDTITAPVVVIDEVELISATPPIPILPLSIVLVILLLPKVTVFEPWPTLLAPITISFCPLL